ncbi:MAG TPA: NUDIX hydrolase [Anaerolineales bacterium]|nr:NUDIX hydrolase [Anaerolineales bacterium]
MTIKPWKVLETSYFRPRFRIDKCELSNGNLLDATVFEFRPWANVIALTKDGEAVLVRQYRHGVCEVMWELPGGVVDDEEDPLEGVKRELLEETGYTASKFVQVGRLYPNPALQTNTLYSFLALGAEKVGEQNLDAGEDIEVQLVPLDELIEMAKRGEFPHALQMAVLFQALAYLDRIH